MATFSITNSIETPSFMLLQAYIQMYMEKNYQIHLEVIIVDK